MFHILQAKAPFSKDNTHNESFKMQSKHYSFMLGVLLLCYFPFYFNLSNYKSYGLYCVTEIIIRNRFPSFSLLNSFLITFLAMKIKGVVELFYFLWHSCYVILISCSLRYGIFINDYLLMFLALFEEHSWNILMCLM